MAITATNEGGGNFAPIEAGTYPARCYSMIHIGTIIENIQGKQKTLNKVRISWEIPTELKEFKQGEGEKPFVIAKDFTLSLNEKATLRKFLASWRGKDFNEEEAKSFDVTKLLGVPCMISVVHKESSGGKIYAEISGVSPVMKGFVVPEQINPNFELNYEQFDFEAFKNLPEFVRKKMESSVEYQSMISSHNHDAIQNTGNINDNNDLPF